MIKVGIIGGGRIGQIHAKAISKLEGAKVVAIADAFMNDETKMKIANNGNIKFFKSHEEMLEKADLDAVYICSPTSEHVKHAKDSIKAKKHVFCEKPVSFNLDEIKAINKLVDESGKVFMVGHNRRFDHNFMALKDAIKSGKVGDVYQLKISSRDPGLPPIQYIEKSGGLFMDMMIHDLDMSLNLINKKPISIYATGAALVNPEIKKVGDIDTAIVTITFEDNTMAVIDNCRLAKYGYDQRAEVHGSLGSAQIGNEKPSTLIVSNENGVTSEKPLHFFLERYMKSYENEAVNFIDSINGNDKPKATITDAYNAVLLAKAAAISLKEKRVVNLSELD
ncbi:myo-inositol 2-dehydrogenase [Mycoplasma testudineum]|uniref:Myo-inositol 2-dehydrogenase n=1 Tax=Mycoplasma testudineum TaxID=244584 RepID=A0A4V3C2S1_9MOLU|nr:inositol 2-dehydrogenase [Mycoplasma testudineum]OYD26478.1 inositol 2-dehydrogenase [Mycoplasma testudineum]TDO18959.1 myo-inositol 2-dehydrogenase [Mycoplasma testudineum]